MDDSGSGLIRKASSDVPNGYVYIRVRTGVSVSNIVFTPQLVDLTAMFGTVIADYVYSLERATAGSGIAWLKSYGFFTKDYYPYNVGELTSVKPLAHKVVGANIFGGTSLRDGVLASMASAVDHADEGYVDFVANAVVAQPMSAGIKFKENTRYTFILTIYKTSGTGANMRVYYTDGSFDNLPTVSATQTKETRVFVTDANKTIDRIQKYNSGGHTYIYYNESGVFEGVLTADEFTPYVEHVYPLDDSTEYRGLFKLDANNKLYCDGDAYVPDSTVTRRFKVVDLGDLGWSQYSDSSGDTTKYCYLSGDLSGINVAIGGSGIIPDIISDKYTTVSASGSAGALIGKGNNVISTNTTNRIFIWDTNNYTTAAAFRTAVTGVKVICKLATPTTEQVAPYESSQAIYEGGTEEYIDTRDVPIPVGHETNYPLGTTTQPADTDFTYDDPPNVNDGQWLWVRTIYSDNSKVYLKTRQGIPGSSGRSLDAIITQYTTAASSVTITTDNMDDYTWNSDIPTYSSATPTYWVRVTNKYSNPISTEYIIYKDNGLTEAVTNAAIANSLAQHANENANGAMGQANNGIKEIYKVWYRTNTATAPSKPPAHVIIVNNNVNNTWTKVKPIENEDNRYYFYCDETVTNGGVSSWTDPVLDTSNLSQYEIGALTAKVKNYWWNSDGAHIASGINGGNVDKNSSISAYGFNSLVGLTGIHFGYNDAKVIDLNTTPSPTSLKFYQPPTISGSTVTQGALSMELSSSALKFYGSSTSTPDAILNSNGLKLTKGGIEAGTPGQSGFIYLSTIDYPLKDDNASPNPTPGLTINGYTPTAQGTDGKTANDLAWRAVVGNKFGVDKEGNLYANNATIKGVITIDSGSNVYTVQQVEQTIYGTIAYQYDNNGTIETVYKRDDTYYWIDSNDEEHIVNEENLQYDTDTGELITIRLSDGFNASVLQLHDIVDNNTQSIQNLDIDINEQLTNINNQVITVNEQFTRQITDINQTISEQQDYIANLSGYVNIASDNIQVGNLSSNSYVLIDGINAKISININGNEVAYMSGDRFYAPSAVVTNLYMKTEIGGNETGDIGWVMRSNGHLSLKRLK